MKLVTLISENGGTPLVVSENERVIGVIELQDVVTGQAPGRTSDDELICCCTLGYAAVDITVANWIYENAKEKGIGTKLNLWENPLWV